MRRDYATAYQWVTLFLCALTSAAQQPGKTPDAAIDKPAATGSVLGRVYLDDTKAPARKATVYLQPAAALIEDSPDDHTRAQGNRAATMSLQTRFDGSFSFSHVPLGTYYVIASCPGYVSPYTALSLAEARSMYGTWQPLGPSQATAKEIVLKTIPRITVGSSLPATIDVPLERGGAISGTITYDDGGPAAGLEVNVLASMLQDGKETWAPLNPPANVSFDRVKTDDRGNYRLSGLPARKYLVQVTLDLQTTITYISSGSVSTSQRGNRFDTLAIYSGSTPRLKDATSVAIDLGEERTGEDLRIPISKLHTITGNIVSAHDGHVINSGQVQLLYADDHSVAGAGNSSERIQVSPSTSSMKASTSSPAPSPPMLTTSCYRDRPAAFLPRNTTATRGTSTDPPPNPCTSWVTWMRSPSRSPSLPRKKYKSLENSSSNRNHKTSPQTPGRTTPRSRYPTTEPAI
jgi:hypothetical protein